MPKRTYNREEHRKRRRRRDSEYDTYASYYPQSRRGCLSGVVRFFRGLAIVLASIVGIVLFGLAVVMVTLNFALFIRVLYYAFYVVVGLIGLLIVYFIIRIIVAISRRLSAASLARSQAKLEREKVKQSQIAVQAQRVKLAQDTSIVPQRYQEDSYQSPRKTRVLQDVHEQVDRAEVLMNAGPVRVEQSVPEIPGMPKKGQVFRYRDYRHLLQAGQLIAGIRQDGSACIRAWDDFKILLILGASSSGKTTTIVEKCVCAVQMGGRLVICDPHAIKPDSLTRRILPLQSLLLPGTMMAMEHQDIMRNIRLVHAELERRRRGASIEVPVFLVIEELNRLMRDKTIATELSTFLEELGQEARGYNIYAILCTQRVSRLADIRNSVIAYIVHKVSPMESSKCLPARYAKYSGELGVGQTFVYDADGTVEPLQQVLITEEDVHVSVKQWQTTIKHQARRSETSPPRVYGAPARPSGYQRIDRGEPSPRQHPVILPSPLMPTSARDQAHSDTSSLPTQAQPSITPSSVPARRMPVTEELGHPIQPNRSSVPRRGPDAFDLLAAHREKKRKERPASHIHRNMRGHSE